MSETSGAVLKIITALTSTKTAIKFISIAIFLLISGRAIEQFVVQTGTPVEYQKTIILFLGLGGGAITGDIIIRFWSMVYSITYGRYKKAKDKKLKEAKEQKNREALLEHFSVTYENMHKSSRRELWKLAQGKVCIWDDPESDSDIQVFVNNGYARHFSMVNEHSSIYELHHTLSEYLQKIVPMEKELALKKFREDKSELMLSLLELLEAGTKLEVCRFEAEDYLQLCNKHLELFEYYNHYDYGEDGFSSKLIGYKISIDPYHKDTLEECFGVKFSETIVPVTTIT
ncbi:hypothetical protein L3X65_25675 [Vibrio diabolicus]|uniref:hypothetical protein n=1 Tax=Vibrio diabolicus TaxID=50719 RepID=UPI00211AB202|nr:hypothetical protein [Vibrio diabolicus]MCG9232505.1 hypothetical protein [Vibrio diabolicus]MCG9574520.1 hypothetical protein [Vibrio diabolicus]MCG9593558.1 hypothetical protein [Vibrio diabolicus]